MKYFASCAYKKKIDWEAIVQSNSIMVSSKLIVVFVSCLLCQVWST